MWLILIKKMLFADIDDAALTAHIVEALQRLINCFACACNDLGLAISLKEKNIMGQDNISVPNITIVDLSLLVVEEFTYLSSTVSSNLSLCSELSNGSAGKEDVK